MHNERSINASNLLPGERNRETHVIEALNSLGAKMGDEKRIEATATEITSEIQALHPAKHALTTVEAKHYQHALNRLVENRTIMKVEIKIHKLHAYGIGLHGLSVAKTTYHVIDHHATAPYINEVKHHQGIFSI